MAHAARPIDSDIVNLDGGIFASLPRPAMPITSFPIAVSEVSEASPARASVLSLVPDVDDFARTTEMQRVPLDSLAPTAGPLSIVPPAPAPRGVSWVNATVLAVGVGCLAAAVALVSGKQSAPVAAAAPVMAAQALVSAAAAPVQEIAAPVKEAAPAAKEIAAPVKEAAPVVKEIAAPVKEAAPAAKEIAAPAKEIAAPVKAAAVPVKAAAAPAKEAAPVSTADLPEAMPEIPAAPKAAAVAFNGSAAAVAVAGAGMAAQACKQDEGAMAVPVSITFAPSGRVTRATVTGSAMLGTPAAGCVAQALRAVQVPAFDGESVTVSTTLRMR